MRKQVPAILVMTSMVMLSSCAMNSSFDCPNKAGVNCRSLDQINGMVDTGEIHGRSEGSMTAYNDKSPDFEGFPANTVYAPGQPLRYGETVQRIWVAPYEDTEGNYHQDNVMYAIVKGGHWIGKPVKSTKSV